MQEILMTPDVCMQFLVWSYFYHDVMPEKNVSYKECGKFSDDDAERDAFQMLRRAVRIQCLQAVSVG